MRRNIIYCIALFFFIILVCSCGVYFNKEGFTTQESIYQNDIPCENLRVNINKDTLERWFIGKRLDNDSTDTALMNKFLAFLQAMKEKCKFKKIHAYLEDISKSKELVRYLAHIMNDVKQILHNLSNEKETGIINNVINHLHELQQRNPVETVVGEEGFTVFYIKPSDLKETVESKSCVQIENLILEKYLNKNILYSTRKTVNGIKRLFCECKTNNKINLIEQDIIDLLKTKNTNVDGHIDYNSAIDDAKEINSTIQNVKNIFDKLNVYVNAKVVEVGIVNTLSK